MKTPLPVLILAVFSVCGFARAFPVSVRNPFFPAQKWAANPPAAKWAANPPAAPRSRLPLCSNVGNGEDDNIVVIRDPRIDTVFRLLFGEEGGGEERCKDLLNSILDPAGDDKIESVNFLRTDMPSLKAEERAIVYDVLVEAECVTAAKQRFIVEIQRNVRNSHPYRWQYYAARELVELSKGIQSDPKISTAGFYKSLYPVKLVVILDLDQTQDFLKNDDENEHIVHWDIAERTTKQQVPAIMSWTFVLLNRFKKTMPKDDNFTGNKQGSWLRLLLQPDLAHVRVTDQLVANENVIRGAYNRIAMLSEEEQRAVDIALDCKRVFDAEIENAREEEREKVREEEREKVREEEREKVREEVREEREQFAKNLLKMNLEISEAEIFEASGLSDEQVKRLKGD